MSKSYMCDKHENDNHECTKKCNSQLYWGGNTLEDICNDRLEIDKMIKDNSLYLTSISSVFYKGYNYASQFPISWIVSQDERTGPNNCRGCRKHGMIDNTFVGYCKHCAVNIYHNKRGNGFKKTLEKTEEYNTKENESTSLMNTIYWLINNNFDKSIKEGNEYCRNTDNFVF